MNSQMHSRIAGALCTIALAAASTAETAAQESAPVVAVVDAFHDALRHGDEKAVMELLAPDAMILESGESQTRAEYEREHLAEDMAFVIATKTERSPLIIRQARNVAWTTATSKTTGTFKGHKIDSTGVELIVLTKGDSGWRIRAIHWSSHEAKGK
jgi:ketosteroid isomerase-like protein